MGKVIDNIHDYWKRCKFEDEYSKILAERRINVCVECEYFKKKEMTCDICKCFMPLKTINFNSTCPKNFWE